MKRHQFVEALDGLRFSAQAHNLSDVASSLMSLMEPLGYQSSPSLGFTQEDHAAIIVFWKKVLYKSIPPGAEHRVSIHDLKERCLPFWAIFEAASINRTFEPIQRAAKKEADAIAEICEEFITADSGQRPAQIRSGLRVYIGDKK